MRTDRAPRIGAIILELSVFFAVAFATGPVVPVFMATGYAVESYLFALPAYVLWAATTGALALRLGPASVGRHVLVGVLTMVGAIIVIRLVPELIHPSHPEDRGQLAAVLILLGVFYYAVVAAAQSLVTSLIARDFLGRQHLLQHADW